MYINNNANFRMLHHAVNAYVVNVCQFVSLIFDFIYMSGFLACKAVHHTHAVTTEAR